VPIEQHRALFARPPLFTKTLMFGKDVATESIPAFVATAQFGKVRSNTAGPWKFWTHLAGTRPDQTKNYVFGIDISKGQGASNSVISVICAETREKIAEFSDANMPPYELAFAAVAAALWFGGSRRGGRPLMIWEANGPGWDFGRIVVKTLQYPMYYTDKASGTISENTGKRYGWHSSREKKEQLLGLLRRAYAHGAILNHSDLALDEALSYVYYDDGGIGPAELTKESEAAKLTHGDRVIADALALLGLEDAPKVVVTETAPPGRSIGHRRRTALVERKAPRTGWGVRWDHRHGV
jgi:hypothetical protein